MKRLSYILLIFLLVATTFSCKKDDIPYVGYIAVERVVVDAGSGASTTVTANTDINEAITATVDEAGAEWCSVSVNGKEITVTTTQANPSTADFRMATVSVSCGYREESFTVLQKYEGQQYLQYDWTNWSATGSDVESSDGGGYPSLFTEDRSTFWHSQYSEPVPSLPHWLVIDMKEDLEVAMVRVGRRTYAANGNNYPTVKTMEVYASTDNVDYAKVGQFTFALPWTAPDGTVINGTSPLVPGYEDVVFDAPVTARYIKLVITETNNDTGMCQVSYFKAMQKI